MLSSKDWGSSPIETLWADATVIVGVSPRCESWSEASGAPKGSEWCH